MIKLKLKQGPDQSSHRFYPNCDASRVLLSMCRSSNGQRKAFLKHEIPRLEEIGFKLTIEKTKSAYER